MLKFASIFFLLSILISINGQFLQCSVFIEAPTSPDPFVSLPKPFFESEIITLDFTVTDGYQGFEMNLNGNGYLIMHMKVQGTTAKLNSKKTNGDWENKQEFQTVNFPFPRVIMKIRSVGNAFEVSDESKVLFSFVKRVDSLVDNIKFAGMIQFKSLGTTCECRSPNVSQDFVKKCVGLT